MLTGVHLCSPRQIISIETRTAKGAQDVLNAHFKAPKTVVFSDLPKTSTGKVQKYVLRARTKEL